MIGLKTVRAKLALGFAIGPLVLLIIGVVSLINSQALLRARTERATAVQTVAMCQELLYHLVDAETNARGYFIAGTDTFLNQYRGAASKINDTLVRFTAAINKAESHESGPDVTTLIRMKMERLQANVQLRSDKGIDPIIPLVASNKGQDLTDQIQAAIGQVEQKARDALERTENETAHLNQQIFDTIVYGTIASIVVLILAGAFFSNSITKPIRAMVEALSSASAEILAGTTQQAAGMREQNSAVTETVATVDEVLQTAEQAAQRAIVVSESSQRAADASEAGRKAVDQSMDAMNVVRERTSTVAEGILALAGQAQSIGDIVASVNDIAEQINLLSLNAAIEASRAGEHGRGFNVVASEIKVLADQSKRATSQVRQILGDIQKATNAAVMVTEEGTKSVADAIKTITEAGTTIRMLTESANDAAEAAAQIAASAGQQTTGMRQIHQAMQNINQVSAQNVTATNQSEQAIRHLTDLGGGLRELVA